LTVPSGPTLQLSAIVATTALAALGYLLYRARQGRWELTLIDALILGLLMTIFFAAGKPLLDAADHTARLSTLQHNLHTLRTRIELYKAEHDGQPPVVHEGSFPQLIRPTNAQGIPGHGGPKFPLGPYLRGGVPVNPLTGRSLVTVTDEFPPQAATGGGGWVYHPPTGQIAADVEGYLDL
jgi:general secretion pathway protein G